METLEPAAGQRPLWEAGLFLAGGWVPDYPGSDEGRFRVLPAPYVIYRGDWFRVGDQGSMVRARDLFFDGRLELDVGLSGAFEVDSGDNDARRGMEDLDFLAEIGPAATFHLLDPASPEKLDLSVQTRAVFSTDFTSIGYEGLVVTPEISYLGPQLFGSKTGVYASAGLLFGLDGMNEYFYEVDPRYATPDRPAYEAGDGYMGTEVTLGVGYVPNERWGFFLAGQLGYFGGAENEDSPLHRKNLNASIGIAVAWSFLFSDENVAVRTAQAARR